MKRIGDVILLELSCAPVGGIQVAIIQREIDVSQEGRHGLEALQKRG